MAAENRLMRIPGGAIAVPAQPVQPPVQEAAPDALAAQKRAIAAKVLSHIQDGDTLFLNSGSTTLRACGRRAPLRRDQFHPRGAGFGRIPGNARRSAGR